MTEVGAREWARPLPPGLSDDDLDRALDAFAGAVGADAVLTSEDDLRTFRDPFTYPTWDDYTASAVVMPTEVEQVQEIVRIANRFKVPLWPHSAGRNNGYGGPAPRLKGSVIVSLRNMNRVLEINEESAYAVVEPGVRWFDLYDAIQAGGHKLMLSIADVGWGSVIGNTLDHGLTYLPYGIDGGMQCGMEVVLPDGDLLRTGMGAMSGNRAWNVYKRGLGPTPDQLFMQSNFGIVTKMGVWLMPYPEVYMPLWLRVWKDDDLGPVVDTLRKLMLDGTIRMVPQIINALPARLGVLARDRWHMGEGPIPDEGDRPDGARARDRTLDDALRALRRRAVVDHRFAKIKEAFERIPGAEVWGTKCAPADIPKLENPIELVQGGVPNLAMNAQTAWYGGEEGGHIGFSPGRAA